MNIEKIKEDRKFVSILIFKILTEKVGVKKVLLNFPKDSDDPSIQATWHAIMHYEADEEIRLKDNLYAQEQIEYLEMIGFILQKGESLPQNIIDSYKDYYNDYLTPHAKTMNGFWHSIKRFLTVDVLKKK